MPRKDLDQSVSLVTALAVAVSMATFASARASAGSAVIGSVAGSRNATLGGEPLLPSAVVFSGDSLKVGDGATVIALSQGSRLVFGRETQASFLRDGNEVMVLLGQGSVSLYHPEGGAELRVKVNGLSIEPASGFKTLGEVAMLDGAVVVTSKEGLLRVEGNGSPVEVAKGRTILIEPRAARAPAPQGAPAGGGPGGGGSTTIISAAALGVGAMGAVVGFVSLSRSNDARDSAKTANTTADAAAGAAAAAANAASAATNLASAAATLAALSLEETNLVGCELNKLANSEGEPSPYTPPSGSSCP
jgi:hypothetical protein